ncbi:hypothetical protein [Fuscovulum blasticum]|uniref:hypothetical protein n=1 Tax=Fuscovulum blasticum TaxID=1075 RepID=UPI000D3EB8EA|nr:hypothetical protein [Fuscovulum blasticum]AWD22308.1 hypothetical protein B6K69_11980 [Fuscovulum blasticum]
MRDVLEPILPVVPVEGIALHIGRSGLSMGDPCEAQLLPDGHVGIFARVRKRFLGLIPLWRQGYLGHVGPVAGQVLTPALLDGATLRLRVVQLTPEHLAGAGMPEILISVWGDTRWLAPFLAVPPAFAPDPPEDGFDNTTPDDAPPARSGRRAR